MKTPVVVPAASRWQHLRLLIPARRPPPPGQHVRGVPAAGGPAAVLHDGVHAGAPLALDAGPSVPGPLQAGQGPQGPQLQRPRQGSTKLPPPLLRFLDLKGAPTDFPSARPLTSCPGQTLADPTGQEPHEQRVH